MKKEFEAKEQSIRNALNTQHMLEIEKLKETYKSQLHLAEVIS